MPTRTLQFHGVINDDHKLVADVPSSVPPGGVQVTIDLALMSPPSSHDPAGEAWAAGVARAWAAEWDDPREDLYTLEDGEPVDAAR